jgi:hypothetical protein
MPGSNTEQQSSVEHARVVAEANAAGRTKAWDICGPSTTSSIIVYTPESPRRSAERSPPPLFLFVINVRSWGTEKLCWGQLSAGYLVGITIKVIWHGFRVSCRAGAILVGVYYPPWPQHKPDRLPAHSTGTGVRTARTGHFIRNPAVSGRRLPAMELAGWSAQRTANNPQLQTMVDRGLMDIRTGAPVPKAFFTKSGLAPAAPRLEPPLGGPAEIHSRPNRTRLAGYS